LTGWYTAEVGRQPWTVYGVLRTADAMTPFLIAGTALTSLVVFCVVYSFIFAFGTYYICARDRKDIWFCLQPPQFPTARCRLSMSTI
jgi:cytochrome bd-type quinol oxidase subunit 1